MSSLESYLLAQLKSIFRPPGGFLRHPFVVPGGIFHDELWDWDSFWIAKGLFAVRQRVEPHVGDAFVEHAVGSWKNFFENQAANGAVPIMVKSNNRDVFGCSEEAGPERNQAKPVFGQFALEIFKATGDFSWVEPYFDGLLRFHDRWLSRYRSSCGLLVWGSDVAIGVDCDPTTYGRPEFSSANLLLNCLFYRDLSDAAEVAHALHRTADRDRLRMEAEAVKAAVRRECWDDQDGFFYSVDVQCGDHRDIYLPGIRKGMSMSWKTLPFKIKMFTGFLPMWCGIASEAEARILVERHFRNEAEFSASHGLRSLAKSERMYEPGTDSANPSNWLGPVWIVASYMVYEGLKAYGYQSDAENLAKRTIALLEGDLERTGTIHECYHPDSGAPNFNADFLSWNVLALLMN